MTHATDTPRDVEAGDWQDRLITAAATVTIGPRSTSEPIRLERLPSWINFEGIIDVEAAERRFELARQGRAFLPALAAWKREVLALIASGQGPGLGDDASELFWGLSGVSALTDVLLEIGWIGGDNESEKAGDPDAATLDAYTAELHDAATTEAVNCRIFGPDSATAAVSALVPELCAWVADFVTNPPNRAHPDEDTPADLLAQALIGIGNALGHNSLSSLPAEVPGRELVGLDGLDESGDDER